MMKKINCLLYPILILIIQGCSQSLIVKTTIPYPLIDQITDAAIFVEYDENIINYEFISSNIEKNESPWTIQFNDSHKKLFDRVLKGFFPNITELNNETDISLNEQFSKINIKLNKFEFLTPSLGANDKYSVWLKYNINISNQDQSMSKSWDITGYGEQKTASLNQNQALIKAIDLALRDTGANLIIKIENDLESIQNFIKQ